MWDDPKEPKKQTYEEWKQEQEEEALKKFNQNYNPYGYQQPSREIQLVCWLLVFLAWVLVVGLVIWGK